MTSPYKKHPLDIRKDNAIKQLLPEGRLRIYEASAGKGELAHELVLAGHDVVVSNVGRGGLAFDLPDERVVDLNGPLPFEDNAFDVIIMREVMEHLESIPNALRECLRCLRPGGRLIATIPNRLQFRSRLFHLLTCFYNGLRSPLNLDMHMGNGHINLIGLPELDFFLTKIGFRNPRYGASRMKAGDFLTLAVWPLCWAATRYYLFAYKKTAENHRKDRPGDIVYNKRIAEALLSIPVFVGKDLIICAEK